MSNTTSDAVRQFYPDTCAIKAQQIILERFGISVSEEQLRLEATSQGWYTPDEGTPMGAVGELLEAYGIPVHRYMDANIFTLVSELAQGHDVIIGVDSGELWNNGFAERMEDKLIGGRPDHALLVSGLDTSDPNDIQVIVTDPGSGDYCKAYPLAQFMDAWKDSNCYMVATDHPVPHIFDAFADTTLDHIPGIGEIPYDEFVEQYVTPFGALDADLPEFGDAIEDFFHDAFHIDLTPEQDGMPEAYDSSET